MSDLRTKLGQRLVACPHWEWAEGMFDTEGRVLTRVWHDQEPGSPQDGDWVYRNEHTTEASLSGVLPDITHPATQGLVRALLRTLYKNDKVYVMWSTVIGAWVLVIPGQDPIESYESEAHVLVMGLEQVTRRMRGSQ